MTEFRVGDSRLRLGPREIIDLHGIAVVVLVENHIARMTFMVVETPITGTVRGSKIGLRFTGNHPFRYFGALCFKTFAQPGQ